MITLSNMIFFVLLAIFYGCYGLDPYDEAKNIVAQRSAENEKLYEKYNIPKSDFAWVFMNEKVAPDESNRKADILIAYQQVAKNDGQCKKKPFPDCLRDGIAKIPSIERCELPKGICNRREKYSELSGLCNNLKLPNTGMAKTAYNRMLGAVYADGINEFRRTEDGKEMPNARIMGNILDKATNFKNQTNNDPVNNFAGLAFSQMIAHDVTSRKAVAMKGYNANGIRCCKLSHSGPLRKNQIHPACIPVELPKNDSFYADKGIFCHNYVRMQPTLGQNCNIANQIENVASSYLDLNTIYSTTKEELKKMRGKKGLFKMDALNIMPVDDMTGKFMAGDFRFGQTPTLGLIHSMFFRFHNIVASQLAKLNPRWDNEKIFNEARRISIATYQHIIYYDWLPKVLEGKVCRSYKLNCNGKCFKYDPKISPATTVEFAMNAFRFYHVNLPSTIQMADNTGKVLEELPLSDTYMKVDMLKEKYNNFVYGFMKQKQRMKKIGYTDEVRNLFLKDEFRGNKIGLDGFILDVMRGRDAGTARFIDYFPMCMNREIKKWKDLEIFFETNHFDLLKSFYDNVKDIELMVGILLERRRGNNIGKIGGCLVAEQFFRYRYGDRFFYAHPNNPHPFTSEQLTKLKRMTFSRFVCMTTDVERVPRKGFVAISKENGYIDCKKLDPLDLTPFKE